MAGVPKRDVRPKRFDPLEPFHELRIKGVELATHDVNGVVLRVPCRPVPEEVREMFDQGWEQLGLLECQRIELFEQMGRMILINFLANAVE